MRYSPKLLSRAFMVATKEASPKKQDELVKNFVRVAAKYGGESYLKKTLSDIERLARKERGVKQVVIHTARPISKKLLKITTSGFHKNDEVRKMINSELVAGIKIVIDDEISIDNTAKRKLEKLFS